MQLRKLLGERWARTQILRLKLQAQIAVATQVAKPHLRYRAGACACLMPLRAPPLLHLPSLQALSRRPAVGIQAVATEHANCYRRTENENYAS